MCENIATTTELIVFIEWGGSIQTCAHMGGIIFMLVCLGVFCVVCNGLHDYR